MARAAPFALKVTRTARVPAAAGSLPLRKEKGMDLIDSIRGICII